jgi:hypothetical protein
MSVKASTNRSIKSRVSYSYTSIKPKPDLKLRASLEDLLYRRLFAKLVESNPFFAPQIETLPPIKSSIVSPKTLEVED